MRKMSMFCFSLLLSVFISACDEAKTSDTGTELEDTGEEPEVDVFSGPAKTYFIDMLSSSWSEPPDVENEITEGLRTGFLISIFGEGELRGVRIATTEDDGTQSLCANTVDHEATVSNSTFSITSDELTIPAVNEQWALSSFNFSATLNEDESLLSEGTLTFFFDARQAASNLFDAGLISDSEGSSVCATAQQFGVACVPCPADGESFCISASASNIAGSQIELELLPRSTDNCTGTMNCSSTPMADGFGLAGIMLALSLLVRRKEC